MSTSTNRGNGEKLRQAKLEERRHEAFRLWRFEGKNLREIGKEMGVSHEAVRLYVNHILDSVADEFEDEVRTWKVKQLKRLMRQYERFDDLAANEETAAGVRARVGTLCLGILKEINDITGIRAAQKHEHGGVGGGPIKTESSYDLTNLTDAELITLKTIQGKIDNAS